MTRLLPFLGAAIGGAAVLALVLALAGGRAADAPAAPTYTGASFSIATPAGWKAVARGTAATVLQRADRRGTVVIRERAALTGSLDALEAGLGRTLARELPDFRPAGARRTEVGGATGLVYTFVRPRANQVQSVVVAPAGDRSYTLDLVADGDAPDVARELAGMVRSFAPRKG